MASTIKVTNINTPDDTGNIIVDRPLSGSGASLTSLPAANLTGTLPAISGASSTNLPVQVAADNSITLAKMAGGVDGNIISYDASGDPVAVVTGSSGQVLTSAGAGAPPTFAAAAGGFTHATQQATTSGTSFTFGSIPSGTKLIYVLCGGISLATTDHLLIQLGDAGGIETSGYLSSSITSQANNDDLLVSSTAGFVCYSGGTGNIIGGQYVLTLMDANTFYWTAGFSGKTSSGGISDGGGTKALSAELTQIKILATGSAAFDAGNVNIMYF